MRWEETKLGDAAYSELIERVWGSDYDFLWYEVDVGPEGRSSFLAKKGEKLIYYSWDYSNYFGVDNAHACLDDAAQFESESALLAWLDRVDAAIVRRLEVSHYFQVNTKAIRTALGK